MNGNKTTTTKAIVLNHLIKPRAHPRCSWKNAKRVISWAMALIVALVTGPAPAAFAMPEALTVPQPPASMLPKPENKPVHVHTGPHKLTKIPVRLAFSQHPTDLEISNARLFQEPLVPMTGKAIVGENEALVSALLAFKKTNNEENLNDLAKFVEKFPQSRWRPAVELNMGLIRFYTGHLEDAMSLWQSSWNAAKSEAGKAQIAIANRSIARLLLTNARLGNVAELEKLLAEIGKRPFYGSDEPMVHQAREGLWMMHHKPECSFKCGPFALDAILNRGKKTPIRSKLVEKASSTKQGTNLAQVKDWADQLGLKYQMAKRSKGAAIVVPAVMHWKAGHFAAVVSKEKDNYVLKDTTFDTDATVGMKESTFEEESDGYFLVPAGALPPGWQSVSKEEGQTVWGKGITSGANPRNNGTPAPPCCSCGTGGSCGMAAANAWLMSTDSNITDTPLSYSNPFNSINFHLNFNANEPDQSGTFPYSNFGLNWKFNWLSYLTVNSMTSVVILRRGDGGSLVFTPSGSVYPPDPMTQATLVSMGSGVYQLQMKDGSVAVYNQADGSGDIYMTEMTDPQGNSTLIQYDANFRITSITDAINQVSTLAYVSNTVGNSGFYKIASIQDPFGRSCSFAYDSTNSFLLSITDVIGLVSKFDYDTSSSFITSMNTPYGTTSFYAYTPGTVGAYPAVGLRSTLAGWHLLCRRELARSRQVHLLLGP